MDSLSATPKRRLLSDQEIGALKERLDLGWMTNPKNVEILKGYTYQEREELAFQMKQLVLYFGDEVNAIRFAEEQAAMAARPQGYEARDLNGLNIGCGDRLVSPYLIPVDIMRRPHGNTGEHASLTDNALLALPLDLPFKEGSLDHIISLHTLEHISDPVGAVRYWLSLLKPGGGLGIVVPDWRYTWDARIDDSKFGHKWNPTPSLLKQLYADHWHDMASLEALDTYSFRMSFDVVLRRHGEFQPFTVEGLKSDPSGAERAKLGVFLHGE
jgi:predicted SAM-dependent methyltransferase